MAFTTIPTYVTNQLITASHANTYWRDNTNQLWPYTTTGDLSYASSATTLARLALGNSGKVLRSNGSLPLWGSPLACLDTFTVTGLSTTTNASWVDIPDATVNIVLPCQCTIIAIAQLMAYVTASAGKEGYIRWELDGNAQPVAGMTYSSSSSGYYSPMTVIGKQTGVAAGTKTFNLQRMVESGAQLGHINIFGIVMGFAE